MLTLGAAVMAALGAGLCGLIFWRERAILNYSSRMNNQQRQLVIAHRGGAGLWPENTLHAFTRAVEMGVDVLEMDVHSTSDGEIVVIHDSTVERTTDGRGYVNAMTLAELKALDAAHHWTADGGASYPLRGRGITIPTLPEVLAAFPGVRFNIEPKQSQPSLAAPLCRMLREHRATGRVMVGAFKGAVLDEFRRACPEVATSASTGEVSAFLALSAASLEGNYDGAARALQVPEYTAGVRVLTPGFVEAAHRRGLEVHAWTINETPGMSRLLDFGVDGIITDYPDRLIELLNRRDDARAINARMAGRRSE